MRDTLLHYRMYKICDAAHKKPVQLICADVAELADAPDLGSGAFGVQVQVLSSASGKRFEEKFIQC